MAKAEPKIPIKTLTITNEFDNFFMLADLHFGMKLGSDEWQENMRSYFDDWFIPEILEKHNDQSALIVLGDVFDDRKNINISVNDMVIDVFEKLARILPVYIINGNHDMYKKSDNTITSLRSLENIHNLHVIKEPTLITVRSGEPEPETIVKDCYDNEGNICGISGGVNPNYPGFKTLWEKTLMMIPYQGDMERETKLANQNAKADYVFMHTDIKNLRYDNGRDINRGVDLTKVKGKVYSGHIHKRQETKKVTYIGSPYQLRRSDIGNQKGVYQIWLSHDRPDLTSKLRGALREGLRIQVEDEIFYENHFSPVFQRVFLSDLLEMEYGKVKEIFGNNYTDILVTHEELDKLDIPKMYEMLEVCKPKRIEIKILNKDQTFEIDEDDESEYKEKSIPEIIDLLIDNMEVDDKKKEDLKGLSAYYIDLCKTSIEE